MMTPLMIWSAPIEIESHACSAERIIAATIAAMTPTMSAGRGRERAPERVGRERLRHNPAARNPTNAADSIIPSMPMFTMPDRSFMTPHSAPSAMGVARPSMIGAMPGVISIT